MNQIKLKHRDLESTIIKECCVYDNLTKETLEQWADGIPDYGADDPNHPEWKATPTEKLDLSQEGYGVVYIKDESNKISNPTSTIKDRPAWEIATIYRDFAKNLLSKHKFNIESYPIPRLTYISSGNFSNSLGFSCRKFNLPNPKILIDKPISKNNLNKLKSQNVDLYQTDLNFKLDSEGIMALTNNKHGVDITSNINLLNPQERFYDWHVHEAFNENPDEIYVPFGSGRIFENYIHWQAKNLQNKDPRLNIGREELCNINILGAALEDKLTSKADKLTLPHNPYKLYSDLDISSQVDFSFTGDKTKVHNVKEERIIQAYEMMNKYFNTEPSASAGLALYLERYDSGLIDPGKKVLIVNTGNGN